MRRFLLTLVAVGLATIVATADEKTNPPDKLAAIRKEATEAEENLSKEFAKLGESKEDQAKGNELYKGFEEKAAKRYEAALAIATADPKAAVAFDALEWILTEPQSYSKPVAKTAMELVRDHHADNPKVGKAVLMIGRFAPPAGEPNGKSAADLLAAVQDKNKDKTVRGQVAVVGAWKAKAKFETAEFKKQKDAEDLATAAEKAFVAVANEFGECKLLSREEKQTLADVCKVELFELQNLRVGKAAPDIAGEDLDGVMFKLSDYRGKVVLLDFWGDW